jgi:hypothetical protein
VSIPFDKRIKWTWWKNRGAARGLSLPAAALRLANPTPVLHFARRFSLPDLKNFRWTRWPGFFILMEN